MKAVVRERYGALDVRAVTNIAKPVFNDDEVLVRVHTAGVNAADAFTMRGVPYLVRIVPGCADRRTVFAGLTSRRRGTLTFGGRRWRPVAAGVCRQIDGTDRLAVVPDDAGTVAYLATDTTTFARMPWYETAKGALTVLALFAVPALPALLGCPPWRCCAGSADGAAAGPGPPRTAGRVCRPPTDVAGGRGVAPGCWRR